MSRFRSSGGDDGDSAGIDMSPLIDCAPSDLLHRHDHLCGRDRRGGRQAAGGVLGQPGRRTASCWPSPKRRGGVRRTRDRRRRRPDRRQAHAEEELPVIIQADQNVPSGWCG